MARIQRPERYVPLSVRFHTGKTGTELRRRFGRDGVLVWACYLTACKLNRPEGEISYASEAEGWRLLGLGNDPPGFTLEEFFAVTGRLKKTRRRRCGDVVDVICTVWGRWTEAQRREDARQQKARKRSESSPDTNRTQPGHQPGHKSDLEVRSKRSTSKRQTVVKGPRAQGLPDEKQALLRKLLKAVGADADEGTPQVLAPFLAELPEASVAKALESLAAANGVRNRARYLVGALESERKEWRLLKDEPS